MVELGNMRYLKDYATAMLLTPSVFQDVHTQYMRDPERAGRAAAMGRLLEACPDRVVACRLARDAGLDAVAQSLMRMELVGELVAMATPRQAPRARSTPRR